MKVLSACRVPVVISALIEDVETGEQGVQLAFRVQGMWQFIECRRSDIADKSRIVALVDKGLPVTSESARYLVRYLDGFLYDNIDYIAKKAVISRLGWLRGKFVPYCSQPRLSENCPVRGLVTSDGKWEEWQTLVRGLVRGNRYLRTFLSASFASVLLEPLGLQNFIVHLWGRTGAGKSVALMLAASVWGDPEGRLFGTMNGTLNYFQSQASMMRNIPLFLDELQTVRESLGNYDKLIMQLGVGVGRGRANRSGEAKEAVVWRNAALCTGEEPLIKPNSGAGAVNRVLQICVDELESDLIADCASAVSILRSNYGHAGARFVQSLQEEDGRLSGKIVDMMRENFAEYHQNILRATPTSGKQAAILAAILTADDIAEITVYQSEECLRVSDVTGFVSSQDEISKSQRAMEYIRNMISIHVNDFKGFFKNEKGEYVDEWGHEPSGKVFGKLTERTAIVNKHILMEWLEEGGYSFDSVKKQWADAGFLIKNSQGRYLAQPPKGMTGSFIKLTRYDTEDGEESPDNTCYKSAN